MIKTRQIESVVVYTDGGARGNPGPAGCGFAVFNESGEEIARGARFIDHATNNVAEYLGVIYGIQEGLFLHASKITIRTDSQLVARQLKGSYKVKDKNLKIYNAIALNLFRCFDKVYIEEIPRQKNKVADSLVNEAIDSGVLF